MVLAGVGVSMPRETGRVRPCAAGDAPWPPRATGSATATRCSSWRSRACARRVVASSSELWECAQSGLAIFYDEALAVCLLIFDDVPGHLGKTVLCKFVACKNGFTIYMLLVGRDYAVLGFEADPRHATKRFGVQQESNARLSACEARVLLEGDEYITWMSACPACGTQGEGEADLLSRFAKQVQWALHLVFIVNLATNGSCNRSIFHPAALDFTTPLQRPRRREVRGGHGVAASC
mmetsp:Transcript_119126/g.371115  ORF Transcript_119126/g.371115 Transcript_119126/m.371115 type:complete len:236 (+) Transcript_119126:83-790(+)